MKFLAHNGLGFRAEVEAAHIREAVAMLPRFSPKHGPWEFEGAKPDESSVAEGIREMLSDLLDSIPREGE